MSPRYTTEELIQILAEERRACMNGERLALAASPTGFSPFLDKFVQADGIQRFTAYQNFQATIHAYQQEYQVSGIVWQQITLAGKELCFPKVHDQLVGLPDDRVVLQAAKAAVVAFWADVTTGMDIYQSLNYGRDYRLVTPLMVEQLMQRAEWALLQHYGSDRQLEIVLQLGWGKPEEASYPRGLPNSGSDYLHAVNPGHCPIG
jgi:hypothetical protein